MDITINQTGELTLGGITATKLAQQYQTPLYVMEEDKILSAIRAYKDNFKKYYRGNAVICYASKAFTCKEMYRICDQEGICTDVVSGGELATALAVGFPAERAFFHGNNKTEEELTLAIQSGVGMIIVDNLTELERVEVISASLDKVTRVSFRIKPGIEAHTHEYIKTGQIDSKFGLALENGEAIEAVQRICSNYAHLELVGLHSHIGSQIFDAEPFMDSARVMLRFLKKVKEITGKTLKHLSLGGGLGVKYTDSDNPMPLGEAIKMVSEAVMDECGKLGLDLPELSVEPGRSIVGEAGTTLYTVGSVKEIAGIRNYVAIDGGMTDNPRYALYGSVYTVLIANRANEKKDYIATVAGRCCESGDLIGKDMEIQKPVPGDILAVLTTGAYNYTMASNYNRVPRPAVVFVKDGQSRVVIRRETYEDLYHFDV